MEHGNLASTHVQAGDEVCIGGLGRFCHSGECRDLTKGSREALTGGLGGLVRSRSESVTLEEAWWENCAGRVASLEEGDPSLIHPALVGLCISWEHARHIGPLGSLRGLSAQLACKAGDMQRGRRKHTSKRDGWLATVHCRQQPQGFRDAVGV